MSHTDLETGLCDLWILSSKSDLPGSGQAQHQVFASLINHCPPTLSESFGAALEVVMVLPIAISCQSSPAASEALGQNPTSA